MNQAHRNPMFWPLVVILAVAAVYFISGYLPRPTEEPTNTPRPTTLSLSTNTRLPTRVTEASRTSLPAETFTPTPASVSEANFYINSFEPVAVHNCPRMDCTVPFKLPIGTQLNVVEVLADGEGIGGDTIWYRVAVEGSEDVYVHRSFVALVRPTQGPTLMPTSIAPTWTPRPPNTPVRIPTQRPSSFTCPQNCDGARAAGLTAQQAASCGLDGDGDGVACYGD